MDPSLTQNSVRSTVGTRFTVSGEEDVYGILICTVNGNLIYMISLHLEVAIWEDANRAQ